MILELQKDIARIIFSFLLIVSTLYAQKNSGAISPDSLVGNVYGTVKDSLTGQPISGAQIYLFTNPVEKATNGIGVTTNKGIYELPGINSAAKHAVTQSSGKFLINNVRTPAPFKAYTIIINAPGYNTLIINQVPVMPGAAMALQVNCRLSKNSTKALYFEGSNKNGPFIYRNELIAKEYSERIFQKSKPNRLQDVQYSIFATREGLVGATCANGHVIVKHDHFVALPSFRVLNKNDKTYDFVVRLTYGNRTIVAPVWDVGPWNVKDDYWNPDTLREIYSTLHHGGKPGLGQGVPEAQAAYYDNYNQGWSGDFNNSGGDYYKVRLPAGIDLADGTFWDDLNLPDNGFIKVNYLWRPGVSLADTVTATDSIPLAFVPGGPIIGYENKGSEGVIINGPQNGTYNGTYYIWWKVKWNDNSMGWSFEKNIRKNNDAFINVTVKTDPDSLSFSADGKAYTSPYTFNWVKNSRHNISTDSQVLDSSYQYIWLNWNDAESKSHTIYPGSNSIFIANFKTQYKLNISLNPSNGGVVSPAGVSWQNGNSNLTITATPADGYVFKNWNGDKTSNDNPLNIKITKPYSLTANFQSITAINKNVHGVPNKYILYQNYPNPFNPSTTIKYALPVESNVRIIIYNSLGEAVDELVNNTEEAGFHEVNFNASNLSSGVYFYKIEAETITGNAKFEKSSKLILLK